MWKKTKKSQWLLAERATQVEKEIIVAEVEHFDKCCEPTKECPTPYEWCCKQCPTADCEKEKAIREKYKELDDAFDNLLKPKSCFDIAGCPICTKTIILIIAIIATLYIITR